MHLSVIYIFLSICVSLGLVSLFFSLLIRVFGSENWGGVPYEDLMMGVDWVVQKYPWVDHSM